MSIPTRLLLQIAESAHTVRTGKDVWVVASPSDPDGRRVFDDEAEARRYCDEQEGDWEVYGPYATETEPSPFGASAGEGADPVASVTLVVTRESGEEAVYDIDPETDSVFFTAGAMDTFLIPHYARIRGAAETAELRSKLVQWLADGALLGHVKSIPTKMRRRRARS